MLSKKFNAKLLIRHLMILITANSAAVNRLI